MSGRTPVLEAVGATFALTALVAVLGARSAIVDYPAVFVTLRVVGCVGLLVLALVFLARGGGVRMAWVLVASSFGFALAGLTAADSPVPFAIGRIAAGGGILVVAWACFAYPSGYISQPSTRRLLQVCAAALTLLLAANLLFSGVPLVAGPFVRCSGQSCPMNPLHVVSLASGPSNALSAALGLATALIPAVVGIEIFLRAARATPLQRHALAPMGAWALVTGLSFAGFVAIRAVNQHAEVLTTWAIAVAAVIATLPAALALGIIRGRVLAMAGLEHLILQLRDHSNLTSLQETMSRVFEDPKLRLLAWRPSAHRYVDTDGRPLEPGAVEPDRKFTEFTRGERRIGAAVHDPFLPPAALRAAGSVIGLALDNEQLEDKLRRSVGALESSRQRMAWAADSERRRIEQDLHDGAQQGLIALRIKLHLLEEAATAHPESVSAGLAEAGERVDLALEQIRDLAQGVYPSVLRDLGLAYALEPVVRDLPIEVGLHVDVQRRFDPELETAVYFCCVEAIQNAVKHAGPDARIQVWITGGLRGVQFAIADNGPGFDPTLAPTGRGLMGMRDRIESVGGTLTVSSQPGDGTTVTGHVPSPAPEPA